MSVQIRRNTSLPARAMIESDAVGLWALRSLATCLLLLGQGHHARRHIAEALRIFDEFGDRRGQSLMYGLNALADLGARQYQAAREAAQTARRLRRGSSSEHITGWIELICSAVDGATGVTTWAQQVRDTLTVSLGLSVGRQRSAW
jgi:hypothetical protein